MTDFEFQIDNFMLYCTSRNLAKKTLSSYEQSLKLFAIYLKETFAVVDVSNVQTGHIRQYVKYLQERGKYSVVVNERSRGVNFPQNRLDLGKKISTVTIANYIRCIKVFFNWLYAEKEITKNPVEKITNPKIERKMKRLLSPEELKKVFSQFDTTTFHGYRNWMISRLLFDTGSRISEALEIMPEDIDFKHKSILLTNPKNKKQRYIYFSPKLGAELRNWLKHHDRYSSSPYLFPTVRGTKLDNRNFGKVLREIGDKLDIEVHPHLFRNSFAKYYILNGGDWASLSRILDHSSAEVTAKAYLDFTNEEIGIKYQQHSPLSSLDV